MVSATLGNADMQRLKMTISGEGPEWRAIDDQGQLHELPVAIQLEDFRIDEYPPKLVLVDNTPEIPSMETSRKRCFSTVRLPKDSWATGASS